MQYRLCAWVKRWLHCIESGTSVLHFVGSEVHCSFVRCYEKDEYENDLSTLGQSFDGQPLPEICLSLVILRPPFSHLYFALRFDCWAHDSKFELRLRGLVGILAGWLKVELLVISPLIGPSHYIEAPGLWRELERCRFLRVPTPPAFAYYSVTF